MFLKFVFCVALTVSTTEAAGTVGEEAKCYHELFKSCHAGCIDKLPAEKKPDIQACLAKAGDNPFANIKTCMNKKGITDDKPCFKKPGHGGLKQFAGANAVGGFETMKDYLLCSKTCIKAKNPACDEGCAKADDTTKDALKGCVVEAMKNGEGPFPCLFKAITGQSPVIPPTL